MADDGDGAAARPAANDVTAAGATPESDTAPPGDAVLVVEGVDSGYGDMQVLYDLSVHLLCPEVHRQVVQHLHVTVPRVDAVDDEDRIVRWRRVRSRGVIGRGHVVGRGLGSRAVDRAVTDVGHQETPPR